MFPKIRLEEEGATVVVCGSHAVGTKYTGKYGYPLHSTEKVDAGELDRIIAAGIDAIIVPGGFAPDYIRRNQAMLALVSHGYEENIPIAAICHGPWVLCSARPKGIGAPVIAGRRATCFEAIKDDVINAGAMFVDEPVVVDGNLITSRTPADLVPFVQELIKQIVSRCNLAS